MPKRLGRCIVCGLRIALHYTPNTNVKLTCEQAADAHRYATAKPESLSTLLRRSAMRTTK